LREDVSVIGERIGVDELEDAAGDVEDAVDVEQVAGAVAEADLERAVEIEVAEREGAAGGVDAGDDEGISEGRDRVVVPV